MPLVVITLNMEVVEIKTKRCQTKNSLMKLNQI